MNLAELKELDHDRLAEYAHSLQARLEVVAGICSGVGDIVGSDPVGGIVGVENDTAQHGAESAVVFNG